MYDVTQELKILIWSNGVVCAERTMSKTSSFHEKAVYDDRSKLLEDPPTMDSIIQQALQVKLSLNYLYLSVERIARHQ